MRYFLHNNTIYCNLVARNYCRGARRKISTIGTKTDKSVRKVHSPDLSQVCCLSWNPTLRQVASWHGLRLRTIRNGSTREK